MPYTNEHAARLHKPDYDQYRRTHGGTIYGSKKVPKTIDIIWGHYNNEGADAWHPQALRFPISNWTVKQAKKWLSDNNITYIAFEPATNKSNMEVTDIAKKKSKLYGVKSSAFGNSIKDIDMSKRTVQLIGNTYFFMDSDGDVLLPGCCKRSIDQRGPMSNAVAKIKHQHDHKLDTHNVLGKFTTLDERANDGYSVLYGESLIPNTTKGNDDLINYQAGIYDNHSIGYRYIDLALCAKEHSDENVRLSWEKYYPLLINPEKADQKGSFWAIKEIELFEISTVSFGANSLTPYIGSKSENKESMILALNNRIDLLAKQLSSGKQSDETMKDFELQILQIKQMLVELTDSFTISTLKDGSLGNKASDFKKLTICQNCGTFFDSYGMNPDDEGMIDCKACNTPTKKEYPGIIKSESQLNLNGFKIF